jgi:hypothetical protein
MTNINGVLARAVVSGLDAATPCTMNSAMPQTPNTSLSAMCNSLRSGPLLLLAGDTAAYRDRVATILVEQLPPIITAIENSGG